MQKKLFVVLMLTVWFFSFCKKKKTQKSSMSAISTFQFTVPALSKGVNLSNWFNDYSDPGQYATRFTTASMQNIKALGFTYVRIPIGSTVLFNAASPSVLNTANLSKVDAGVKNALDAGLGVTINLHPWQNTMDSLLAADAATVSQVASYWKAMAAFFKKYPADKLFFEVYNEPHASAAGLTAKPKTWWQNAQQQLITSIRSETADHYIIAGGEEWNSINGLLLLQPYAFPKVIYNIHFYDPFLFTHQGASWAGWEPALLAKNIPYPSSPENVAALINSTSAQSLKDALGWYGSQRYNSDSLNKWIQRAANWAVANNVLLICNEFGSYKPFAPRNSRLQYIRDTRTVLEQNKIGWAMWEYDEGFGLIEYNNSNRNNPVTDIDLAIALGLR
jgi:endoglucanase